MPDLNRYKAGRSLTRYFGKICEKHPELEGERRTKTYLCIDCTADKRKERRSLPVAQVALAEAQRERRLRNKTLKSSVRKTLVLAETMCKLAKGSDVGDFIRDAWEALERTDKSGDFDVRVVKDWYDQNYL